MRTPKAFAFCVLIAASVSAQGRLVVDDPLTGGTTTGVRDNGPGQFVAGGWRVTGASDNIRYTPEIPIEAGAIEFDVTGLCFDDTREQNHRGQILSMYDASFGDPRHVYAPDVRLNPFKFVLQRNGRDEEAYFANHLKLIMNTDGVNQFEDYSSVGPFPWDESKTYRMRLEWKDGLIRFFIDGRDTDRWPFVYRSTYRPAIHDIRIGTKTRNNAILDAVYSNVKIYDLGAPPVAPVINNPRAVADTLTPILDWESERHTRYHARVTSTPDPDSAIVWDSVLVPSANPYVRSGPLSDGATYFAHVRLRNAHGWGAWSAPQRFETRAGDPAVLPTHTEHELVFLSSTSRQNPYTDISLRATFESPTRTMRIDGFWDGGALYKVRVPPTEPGLWSWHVSSNDPSLHGKAGTFVAEASTSQGYVRVSPTLPYTFEWAGTGEPFFLPRRHDLAHVLQLEISRWIVPKHDRRSRRAALQLCSRCRSRLSRERGWADLPRAGSRPGDVQHRLVEPGLFPPHRPQDRLHECAWGGGGTLLLVGQRRLPGVRDPGAIPALHSLPRVPVTRRRTFSGSSSASTKRPGSRAHAGGTICAPSPTPIPTAIPPRSTPW